MGLPQCFGEYWDATGESQCVGCGAKDDCLAKFATGVLVRYQQELGDEATPENLAARSKISVDGVLLALNFQKNIGLGKPAVNPPLQPPTQPKMTEPKTIEPPTKPQSASGKEVPPPISSAPAQESGTEEAVTAKKSPAKKAAMKKTAAKPKPGKKKPAKKAEPKKKVATKAAPKKKKEQVSDPTKAGAAKSATAPAKPKREKSVKPVSEQAGPKRIWNTEHDLNRWKRERKRSKDIAALKPGQTLTREWPTGSGEIHKVKVGKGKYTYLGKQYPTLYMVVKVITGTKDCLKQKKADGKRPEGQRQLTDWSAAKFFRLGRYAPKKAAVKKVSRKKK